MESKSSMQLLVNFDGKRPYCIIVFCPLIDSTQIPKIAAFALSRYNSIHSTTFDLQKCTLFLTDSNDVVIDPIDKYDPSKDYELVIRLPDFKPITQEALIPLEIQEKFANEARENIKSQNFYSAYTFASYSPGYIKELTEKISNEIYKGLTTAESHNFNALSFIPDAGKTVEDLIAACEENRDNLMAFRKYCNMIAKKSPLDAIRVIFNFPTALKILPEFCQTKETFDFVLKEIKKICVTPACYRYFSEIFFEYGLVEKSSQIYSSVDIIAEYSEQEFREYCWKLFLLFDLNKLHQALVIFFRMHKNSVIGTLRCDKMYTYLCDIYTGISTPESAFISTVHLENISEKQHPDLCHIFYMGGLLLFYCGMYDHFYEVMNCYPCETPDMILKKSPSAREWKLGRSIIYNQGWGRETAPKDRMHCVLCDYKPYKNHFIEYDLKRPHDVYLLSHVSFYELACEEPSFAKKCFWNLIEVGSQYKSITLINGHYDVKVVIPHLVQYLVYPKVNDAVKAVAKSVIEVFEQIHKRLPSMFLYFVRLENYKNDSAIVMNLNDEIERLMENLDYAEFRDLPSDDEIPSKSSDYYGKHFPI